VSLVGTETGAGAGTDAVTGVGTGEEDDCMSASHRIQEHAM
jgi:hypothetical protein